jgi:phosphonate transport system permease protein
MIEKPPLAPSKPFNRDEERKPSLVDAWGAAIASILIPGAGQMLARRIRRGLTILASFVTILGLLAWRMRLTARFDTEVWDIIIKSFRLDPYLLVIAISVLVLYIWSIYDATLLAKDNSKNPIGVFFWIMVVFFMLGWQIGQIDPVRLVTEADEAGPALGRVLWPWSRAITYPETLISGIVEIQSPCTDTPFPAAKPLPEEPWLVADPTCGVPSEQDGSPGTLIHLEGGNFSPDTLVELWWRDPIGNQFRQRAEGEYVSLIPEDDGTFSIEVIFPYRLIPPTAREEAQIWKIEARQVAAVGDPVISQEMTLVIEKMIETIFIGMMATFFGIILSLPLSFFAARNLMSANRITLFFYYLTRTLLNIIRSIEPLIWAIIFVIIVGLGPYAGILALTLHSAAALGKLYSEAIESIDPGPIEAIQATGANWLQMVMYAVVPQVIPPFVSFTIYRWDINIRMSTIIGFVGGGGIGFLLAQWIRLLDYRAAGLAVWFIALTVAILDYVSAEIRARYV